MKIHKAVAYSSLLIILLLAGIIGSLPARFPNSTIAWVPIITFIAPAVALAAFLLLHPLLPRRSFRLLLAAAGILSVAMTLTGAMSIIILLLFLLALGALYIQRDRNSG